MGRGRRASATVRVTLFCAGLFIAGPAPSPGQWTQWRGPERDGSMPPRAVPEEWPPSLDLLWERDVGEGYSGPVTDGRRVWVHSRRDGMEVVSSLRLDDGELVWSEEYPAPFQQDESALAHGEGPYSTPSLAEGRLFTLGIRAVLSAWEADTGELLWRADYSEELVRSHPYFGAAASPLAWGGLCFVHFGDSGVGERGVGPMAALRVTDGGEAWRWDDEGPALGASPVIHEIAGQPQLVFKSQAMIVGVDPRTGRDLWRIPFRVAEDNTIVTPFLVGDRLLTSDYDKGVSAWRILPDGDGWAVRELWVNGAVSLFTSSPVLAAGQLVAFSGNRRGHLVGLDLTTGEIRWRGEPRWGEHASLVASGDQVLVFREDGSLVVGVVSARGFQIVRTYRLGRSITWAHPAIAGDRIIVRDRGRVALYGTGGGGPRDAAR